MDLTYTPIFGLHDMREGEFQTKEGDSIRIQSIELNNFKGVKNGAIELFSIKKPLHHEEKSNILAIYGQNGSGKTTLIEALYVLKEILIGHHLPENADEFISQGAESAHMKTVFEYQAEGSSDIEYITYEFSLRRRDPKPPYETTGNVSYREDLPFEFPESEQSVEIFDELLTVNKRDYQGKLVSKTKKMFDTSSSDKVLNASLISLDYITDDGETIHRDIPWESARKECLYYGESLLFNQTEISWVSGVCFADEPTFDEHIVTHNRYAYIELLSSFAQNYLYIAGANLFKAFSDDVSPIYLKDGIVQTHAHTTSEISHKNFLKLFLSLVNYNKALSQIIPGLELSFELDKEDMDKNPSGYNELNEVVALLQKIAAKEKKKSSLSKHEHTLLEEFCGVESDIPFGVIEDKPIRIRFYTQRGETKVPLSNESEGIKRIIYALDLFVAAYNNPGITVVIDEFDAGIFEFLLGEILQIFEESGKGQLIFTSHNLRPLEVLDRKAICFTTTNPENRYIRLKYIGHTNNLRDVYFRQILVGEQDEEIYKSTKRYKLVEAFESAGEK